MLIHTIPPCLTIWRSARDSHTTTVTPQHLDGSNGEGEDWQSIGLVSTIKLGVLRQSSKGKFEGTVHGCLHDNDSHLLDRLKKSTIERGLDWNRLCRRLPQVCGKFALENIVKFPLEKD